MYTSGVTKEPEDVLEQRPGHHDQRAEERRVPKWRSVRVMVTAPSQHGMTAISRYAVISQVQQNIGICHRHARRAC